MRVRYVLLLTLLLLTFTGIRLTSAERARASITTDDVEQLRSRHMRSDVSLDTPSSDTIERIRAVMVEMALRAAEKHDPETLFSTNADFNGEKTNQWLNDIEYPEEFLQILEEMRNSLVYEGKEGITPELEKRLITAVGGTGGTGTTLPWDTPNRSDIVASPPPLKQSSHQDEAVLNGKDRQPPSIYNSFGQEDERLSPVDEEVRGMLLKIDLRFPSRDKEIIHYFRELGSKALPTIGAALKSDNPRTRRRGIMAIVYLEKPKENRDEEYEKIRSTTTSMLLSLLDDEEPQIRGHAGAILGGIAWSQYPDIDSRSVDGLVRMLSDEDESIRGHAVTDLIRIGKGSVVPEELRGRSPRRQF